METVIMQFKTINASQTPVELVDWCYETLVNLSEITYIAPRVETTQIYEIQLTSGKSLYCFCDEAEELIKYLKHLNEYV